MKKRKGPRLIRRSTFIRLTEEYGLDPLDAGDAVIELYMHVRSIEHNRGWNERNYHHHLTRAIELCALVQYLVHKGSKT